MATCLLYIRKKDAMCDSIREMWCVVLCTIYLPVNVILESTPDSLCLLK